MPLKFIRTRSAERGFSPHPSPLPNAEREENRRRYAAEVQALYVERDGAFVLDVEGAVKKTRLDG
jgi:hypothetical protein